MALNFPTNPSLNDTYTYQGTTYVWDGEKWDGSQPFIMNTANIVDGAVTTEKIADGAVTTAKIDIPGGSIAPFQEGLWIPEYYATTTDPTCGYDIQQGFYSRVGSLVTVIIRLNAGDPVNDGNRGAGSLGINNLPYDVKTSPNEGVETSRGTGSVYATNWSTVTPDVILANSEQNGFRLYGGDTGSSISVNRLASGCSLYASCVYTTDDTTWTPINGATVS